MRRARPRSRRLWHLAGALLAISLAVASVATPRGGTRAAGDARARRRDSERGGKESGETERTPPPRGEVVARARAASSRTPPLSRPRRRKDYERRRLDAAVDPAFGAGGEEAGAGGETCAGACGLCRASCCCDGDCVALGDCCGDFSDDGVCEAQKEGNLGGGRRRRRRAAAAAAGRGRRRGPADAARGAGGGAGVAAVGAAVAAAAAAAAGGT